MVAQGLARSPRKGPYRSGRRDVAGDWQWYVFTNDGGTKLDCQDHADAARMAVLMNEAWVEGWKAGWKAAEVGPSRTAPLRNLRRRKE